MSRAGGLSNGANTIIVEWSGVVLTNRQGEILLNLRDRDKQLFPNMWDLIGGTLEPDESPEACALREVFEETGESLDELVWLKDFDVPLENGNFGRLHLFCAEIDRPASQLKIGEGQEHRFFNAADLQAIPIAPGIDVALNEFFASGHNKAAAR